MPTRRPSPRHQLAKLLTDYSCQKLSGDQFVNEVLDVRYRKDKNLDFVVDWIIAKFDPDFTKPDFDIDNPPFDVRRKLALFRRFLLSGEPYRWPAHAWGSSLVPMVRLYGTAFVWIGAMGAITFATIDWRAIPLATVAIALAAWMYLRERHASEQDWQRAQAHARQFGDPEMWPFLMANDFRRAGPSRLLWNRQL